MGETQKHGDNEWVLCGEHAARATHEVDVGLLVIEGICLDLGLENKVGVAGVCEAKYSAELVDSKVADVANLELGGLSAHLELNYLDLVRNNGGLCALVEGGVEHLNGIVVKLVGEARPVEGERHESRRRVI